MNAAPTTLEGVVERREVLEGTRSARSAPVLVVHDEAGAGAVVRLHIVGDESFSEDALEPFVGKRVRVGPGTWRNRVLRITLAQIVEVSDATSVESEVEPADLPDATAASKVEPAAARSDRTEPASPPPKAESPGGTPPGEGA